MRSAIEYIRLNKADNVVALPWGGREGESAGGVVLNEEIPPGHKVACSDIPEGGLVIKYGHPIGVAPRGIRRGDWAHEHNVKTRLADSSGLPEWENAKERGAKDGGTPDEEARAGAGTFWGFRRPSGRAGVRNDLWVIPSVGCVNGELRSILREYRKPVWVDAVRLLEHPYGCSQLGGDLEATKNALAGLAGNPNAGGALLVGLGCENLQVEELEERARELRQSGVRAISLQRNPGGVLPLLDELAEDLPRVREEFPLSGLCVGVKCGGSDGYSGLTANPLVGYFSGWLARRGGAVLATEIPEMFGAEEFVASRIGDEAVFRDFIELDKWFRDYFTRYGQPIYENPSPGNKAGGITTLEEKSLGAVEKMGGAPVTRVLRYGEPAGGEGGVQIVFAPGNDLVSCTSLAASGAQIILFTTGRGTPFGSVAPTIKISTHTALWESHPGWIDFDAGGLLAGEPWEDAGARLVDFVLRVAGGEKTRHEKKDFGGIAIFKDGATL
jgi:altronate hydrolase